MDLSTQLVASDGLFEKLMSCPIKRKLVLSLIASEKDNIERYKKNLADQKRLGNPSDQSPLRKIQKKHVCESPTALLRRRALEQPKNPAEIQWSPAKNTSISSSPGVFNEILSGVVAFIDVKSKDHDRSGGVRALLLSMGAKVQDNFNREVTHVIFKDGSFSTYQRANLMKVHLVSVLWIEACRTSGVKVAEKKFPALGTDVYDHNVSALCSQLQKDYEGIIREEYCRSMRTGTPLPSTRELIDKRRTIMTPNASNSSFFEKNWSQEHVASEDTEVADINQKRNDRFHITSSPEMTEDESDLAPFIAGEMVPKKKIVDFRDRVTDNQSTEEHRFEFDSSVPGEELNDTDARKVNSPLARKSSPKTPCGFYSKNTPKINRSRTFNIVISDESFANSSASDGSGCKRRSRLRSAKKDEISLRQPDTIDETPPIKKRALFQVPTCTKKHSRTSKMAPNRVETSTSEKGQDVVNKSTSTSMSTLQLSNNNAENSINTTMSQLQISSDTSKGMNSFNSNNNSFSPIQTNVMKDLMEILDVSLQKSDNITRRRKKTVQKDGGSSKVDEINSAGSFESDQNEDLDGGSGKATNARKRNSLQSRKSKLETPGDENALTGIGDQGKCKKTGELVCDAAENSETHVGLKEIYNGTLREDLFDNDDGKLCEIPKTDRSISTKSSSSSEKEKSVTKTETHVGLKEIYNGTLREDLFDNDDGKLCEIPKTDRSISTKSSSSSEKEKSVTKTRRKLYDPDNFSRYLLWNDRHEKILRRDTENPDTLTQPNVILSSRAKRFVEEHNINVEKILSDQKSTNKERKTDKSAEKQITDGDDGQCESDRHADTDKENTSDEFNSRPKPVNSRPKPANSRPKTVNSLPKTVNSLPKPVNSLPKPVISRPKPVNSLPKTVNSRPKPVNSLPKTVNSLPTPVGPDEKSTERRCSTRLTRRFGKVGTGTVSETDLDISESRDSNQKLPDEEERKHESVRKKTKKPNSSPYSRTVKTAQLDEISAKRRCSMRLTQRPKKFGSDACSRTEKIDDRDSISRNRRSTREFQSLPSSKKKTRINKLKQPSIVCTKMHKDEIQVFSQIVKKLGGFFIEDEVTEKTTHLVAGEPKRTINMLMAIVTGCWIVKKEWLYQSLEAGKWLPEEDFELTEFSPAVQQCRLQRQAFGASFSMDIFQDCGPVYIAKGSTPRCSDLRELVTLCKGKCTNNPRISKIAVGELLKYDGVTCVKENWILDSITFNRRMPFKTYMIPSSRASTAV